MFLSKKCILTKRTERTILNVDDMSNKTPKRIPIKLLDIHTKSCKECEKRRLFMENYYKIKMDPEQHSNEWVARDEMLGKIKFDGI